MHVIVDGAVYGRQRFGGINTYFNQVLARIAQRPDTRVDVLVPDRCKGTPPGPPVRRLRRDFIPAQSGLSWRLDQRLAPRLESLKLQCVGAWARTRRNALFVSTYLTWVAASLPQVAMAHDMNHELFPELYDNPHGRWLRRQYPEYLRRARRVIAVSETTKADVERYYRIDSARIDVVYHAVDRSQFFVDTDESQVERLERSFGICGPYVLYVGSRTPYKNFPLMLEAMARLYPRTGLTLVVVGAPWDERESTEVLGHAVATCLRLVPYPDEPTLRALYSRASAFVFPSRREGFGIPLLEAMACGAPVIASDIEVFREVAGPAPLYFDAADVADLVRVIEKCLDPQIAAECRERGFSQVNRYSWERAANATYAVYEKACAAGLP